MNTRRACLQSIPEDSNSLQEQWICSSSGIHITRRSPSIFLKWRTRYDPLAISDAAYCIASTNSCWKALKAKGVRILRECSSMGMNVLICVYGICWRGWFCKLLEIPTYKISKQNYKTINTLKIRAIKVTNIPAQKSFLNMSVHWRFLSRKDLRTLNTQL